MAKKTLESLLSLCMEVWEKVDEFCGTEMNPADRSVVFAAVRQRLLATKKPEKIVNSLSGETAEPKKEEPTTEKKKKFVCKDKFNPEKDSKCSSECKNENPEEYKKCLETFQEEVKKKAKANGDSSEKKKGRTFDKDFWGFDKSSVTGKINEILSKKFVTKTEIAEAVGIDSQRVAVHFSNLRKGGFVLKKKKDEMRGVLYKLTKEKSE